MPALLVGFGVIDREVTEAATPHSCNTASAGSFRGIASCGSESIAKSRATKRVRRARPEVTGKVLLQAVQAGLWQDLESLGAKAKAYKSHDYVTARLKDKEVETIKTRYPDVGTSVNRVFAGQEYPPPAGYLETVPELSKRLLPESHGKTFSWPGLPGLHFEVAKEVILAQFPGMLVQDCGQAAAQTSDYVTGRVRMFTNHKHIVRSVPSSG